MSKPPAFDDRALAALQPVPPQHDRAYRVRLLAEFFTALLDGKLPSKPAVLFVAGGGMAWITNGGDLCRDYWEVAAPAGSHRTPAAMWGAICSSGGATDSEDRSSLRTSQSESERKK